MWSAGLAAHRRGTATDNNASGEHVGMDGHSGAQVSAPADGWVDVLVGDDAESAQPSASSPVEPGQTVYSVSDMG